MVAGDFAEDNANAGNGDDRVEAADRLQDQISCGRNDFVVFDRIWTY